MPADLLTPAQVQATAASIRSLQQDDGAIPWALGQHTDVWNHVESAMGLLVAGDVEAAERAYRWCATTQRADGSWPMKFVGTDIEDASGETNMSGYLAVGLWHHWLVRRDLEFVEELWPCVRRALDWVVGLQLPFGGIAWSQEYREDDAEPGRVNAEALLAGSSSIHQSLRAGVSLSELLDDPQPHWELVGGRLAHALRRHPGEFLDKSTFSMDWYYPVLGGAVRGETAEDLLARRWDDFVVPGLGVRCVDTNDWVTGAESCELVLTLEAIGDRERAAAVFADIRHLRDDDGGYWTGFVFGDDVVWPAEHTSYTAGAVLLANDALGDLTPGADIMRGHTLAGPFPEIGLECGCPDDPAEFTSPDRRRSHSSDAARASSR